MSLGQWNWIGEGFYYYQSRGNRRILEKLHGFLSLCSIRCLIASVISDCNSWVSFFFFFIIEVLLQFCAFIDYRSFGILVTNHRAQFHHFDRKRVLIFLLFSNASVKSPLPFSVRVNNWGISHTATVCLCRLPF